MSYRQQSFSRIFTSLIVSFNLAIPQAAFAIPEGGVVTGGSASISGAGTDSMIIDQTSQRSFIEWDSFNVGEGQSVEFRQPNSDAVTANKVIGTDPSEIFGQITANGRLLIINGNGIIFGANSVIDAAAFIATTHDLSTDDFMNGDDALDFSGGTASIINNGNIALREGGFAALLAPQIVNNGVITARLGKIELAASQSVSVDFYGDGLLSFAADDALTQSLEDSNAALIDQQGELLADGGIITMTTRAASDVINRSVNIGGLVRANAVSEENGRIILSADGAVIIEDDGVVRSDGNDGSISISGTQIAQGGLISASGTSGAGTISLNATGRLSLAGTTSAIASSGQGGQITYRAGTIIENSSSVTNVSGTTQGGGIMVQAEIGMISSGTYFANASSGTAGQIDITGNDIRLLGTTIEAKGTSQGGLVRVGGAFQGGKSPDFSQSYVDSFVTRWPDAGSLKNANQVFINNSAVINVTSQDGTAGTAIIWSDDTTTFLGSINATGQSGGSVEVSSATLLRHANLAGIEVGDGTLLLDPKNITIGSSTEVQSWSFDGIIGQWYSIDYDPDLLRSDERFGQAVSLSTDSTKLAVGAHGNDGFGNSLNMVGAVHLFTFTNSNYGGAQLQGTIGSGYTGGNNVSVTNLQAGDLFGKSVSLDSDGDRLAVGAPGDQGASNDKPEQGAVYLFTFTNTSFAGGQLAATIGKGYSDLNMTAIASNDAFGSSVSLNGTSDRLAVGATGDDGNGDSTSGSGAVYLLYFGNNSFGTPTLHGTIGDGYSGGNDVDLSTLDAGDMFGSAVDFTADSMRLLIGAPGDDGKKDDTTNAGAAYLYGFENANFKNPTLLSAIGKDYTGNSNVQPSVRGGDSLGTAVAINSGGNLVAIGAAGDDGYGQSTDNNYGAVHLIRYTNSEYTASSIIGKIGYGYTPSGSYNHAELNTNDAFGTSVALNGSGNRLAVGAPTGDGFGNSLSDSGDVYLFSFTDTAFSGVSKDAALGDNRLNNPFPNNSYVDNQEEFGAAVSLNGDATRLAVSALDDGGNPDSANVYGAVHLYSFTDSNYSGATLQGTIGNGYSGGKNVSYNPGNGDEFGVDVSLNSAGDRLAVGETGETGGGAVRLFTFTDTSFTGGSLAASIYEGASGGDNVNITLDDNDDFGASVDLSGDGKRLAVGAPGDDGSGNSGTDRGAVYLFTFNDTSFDGGQLITTVGSGYNTGSDFSVSTLADNDAFGSGVSLDYDANRLAVGAEGDAGPDGKSGAGAAYLIEFGDASFTSASLSGIIGDGYSGSGYLNVSNLNSSDAFGSDLSLNATGDRLIVGAVGDDGDSDGASNSGAAYLFSFSDDDFSSPTLRQTFGSGYTSNNQLDVTHLEDNDGFGASVSLNDAGDRLVVGNQFDDGMTGANTNAGAVFLFSASRASGGYPASGQTYAANDSSDVTVNAYEIADIMTRGSNIILQASNDITVSNAIEVGTFSSSNGDLTLSAGRSIIINETIRSEGGDINLYANTNLADGVQDAQRDTGEAVISLANTKAIIAGTGDVDIAIRVGTGKTYSQSGDISLGTNAMIAGDMVTIINAGPTSGSDITLASGASISASNSGDAITLAADNFINNAGASALSVPNGRFQIWSTNPSSDTLGGITSDFIQYNATYGTSSVSGSSSQDGLLYTYQPTVSPNFRANTIKTYDGTATATVADGDIGVTGAQTGDTVVLTAASASFDNKNAGTGKTVTLSGLSVASAARGAVTIYGYGVSTNTASNSDGTINQKPISMTGHSVANKQYDGTTTGTATFGSLTGVESGDTVTLDTSSASAAFINAGVGTNKTVTISGITLGGTDGANYGLTTPTTTADITQKTLTLSSATAANKTYNADNAATISAYGGLTGIVNSEAVSLDSSSASASFADANVGSAKSVSISGLALTGANASNYTLSSSFSTTADITAKALTITAPSASDKTYDADTSATVTAGTLSGFVGSETVTVTGSGTFSDANVGSGKSVTVTYSLADGTNNGLASNYSLASGSTTADITAKALTITAPSASDKTYDADTSATVTAGTLSGFIGSETVTVTGSGTFSDANVGSGKSVTVTYSLADGTNNGLASNYSLSSGSTTADITAKTLTITAPSASNKTYDADTSATVTAGTLSGFIGSETVTVTGSGTFADANVGSGKSVTVTYSLADGTNNGLASNYSLASGSTTADITAKTLTITAPSASNKTYDADTSATVTAGTLSGFIGSETVTVTGSGTFSDANVGSGKSVTVTYSLADGTNNGLASNYSLASGSTTADITAKALTITAPSASDKTYDADTSATVTAGTLSGFIGSETVTVTGSGTFSDANVGSGKSVTVTYSLADGTNNGLASNYSLSSGSTTADITAKTLTITAPSASNKTYDADTSATVTAGTLSGFIGSETVTVTGSGTFSDANVGSGKSVTVTYSLADGTNNGLASNYSLASGSTTADITAKTLTITAPSASNKTYDADTSATVTAGTLSGFVGSETVTVTGSGTFADANVGSGKSVTVTYSLADGTNNGLASNYSLASGSTTADITAKALTITAPSASDKTYDADTSATVTAGTLSGFIGSETVTVTGSGTFSDANVGSGKSVTVTYTLADGTNNGLASNYSLASGSTTADITAKALTITAPSASDKVYDADTSATVTAGTLSGFVGSETVTVTGSGTFSDANVGSGKSVTVTYSLADGTNNGLASNYSLSSGSTTADITAKTLTITAPSASNKTYDADTSATVTAGTLSGFIGSETVTVTGSGTFSDANVGSGKSVTVTYSLADGTNNGLASNYSLASGSTTADITAKTLTITAPSASNKTYDADTSATVTAGTLSGFVGSETVTVTGTGTFSDANVGSGKSVTVTYSLADGTNNGLASNYSLSSGSTTADITAKALTITAPSASNKTYDADTSATVTAGTLSGFVGSETVTVTGTGTFSDANVGSGKSVTVTYSLADGTNNGLASNYSLASGSTTADITAKTLTITAPSASNKTYDADTSATVTAGTLSGFVGSETVTVTGSGTFSDANVGSGKSVTVTYSLADGTNNGLASNYSLASGSTTADITAKALTITAPSASDKTYDADTSATVTAGTLSGFIGSETVTVTGSGTFSDANVGSGKSVTVTYSLADGTNNGLASNYSLAGGSTTADITAKALTITAPSASDKTYDADTSATVTAGTLSGFIGSETVTVTGSGTFSDANVGSGKSVTVTYSLADGTNNGLASNYSLASGSTTADITAKALTITAPSASNRAYDGSTSATITAGTLSGFVGSETVTVTGSGTFADANVGSGKSVTVTYSLADGTNGGIGSNYSLVNDTTTATISKRLAVINGLSIANKTYDATNAATVTSYGTLGNLAGSDSLTLDTSSATASYASANVGTHIISLSGLVITGAQSANYDLAFPTLSASIAKKPLSVSGTSVKDKIFDNNRVAAVYLGSLSGLIGTQTLQLSATGTFNTALAGINKPVTVNYKLANGSNGGLASNYSLSNGVFYADITGGVIEDKAEVTAPIIEKQIAMVTEDVKIEHEEKMEIIERIERIVQIERIEQVAANRESTQTETETEIEAKPETIEAEYSAASDIIEEKPAEAFVEAIGSWTILRCENTDGMRGVCSAK